MAFNSIVSENSRRRTIFSGLKVNIQEAET